MDDPGAAVLCGQFSASDPRAQADALGRMVGALGKASDVDVHIRLTRRSVTCSSYIYIYIEYHVDKYTGENKGSIHLQMRESLVNSLFI